MTNQTSGPRYLVELYPFERRGLNNVVRKTRAPDRIAVLDTASIVLAVAGVACGNLISLPPDSQLAQLWLIFAGLNTVILVIRDRRAASRQETVRTLMPTRRRVAATGAVMTAAVAMTIYVSGIPGHGWIAIGLLLVFTGFSARFLVQDRKLTQ